MRAKRHNSLMLMFVVLSIFVIAETSEGQARPLPGQEFRNRMVLPEFRQPYQPPVPNMSPAPPKPVHACAEWEESEGIILNHNWKNADTIYKMQLDHPVYIQVNDSAQQDTWVTWLNDNSIPMTNIHFVMIPATYAWMRDCGPWFIWDGNNELCIVNNTCWQGNYPDDDIWPYEFAQMYGFKYYDPVYEIYCEGGNYYPNAYGTAFSTSFLYSANVNKTKELTDQLAEDYLGIEHYHTATPHGLFHHDTCCKPADPETLVIAQWPEDYYKHPIGEGIFAHYETLESPWGRPYKIHRIPMFPTYIGEFRPYLNCLVANKQLYVPITHTSDDEIALGIFQEAFEGYDVTGVDFNHSAWGASLHCATKLVMKEDIIRIYPYPPGDTEDSSSSYTVTADVIPSYNLSLLAGYPVLRWTDTGGAPFSDIVMQPTGQPNEYTADIPAQPQGTAVSFYIEAHDEGERTAVYPPVAPDGMMSFQVRQDTEAPKLTRFVPTRSASAGQSPLVVRTLCKDDMATPEVYVEYAINGTPQPAATLDREEMCYWYSGSMGDNTSTGDVISYQLKATDNAESPNIATLPLVGKYYCPVTEPADCVGIVDLSPRPFTGPFLHEALGTMDIPHAYYKEWPADLSAHDVWFICLGVFADNHILSVNEASDIVAALQAGKYIYLEGGDTWCHDPEKETLKPWFGVAEFSRGWLVNHVNGTTGGFLEGMWLPHAAEAEDICINRMQPVAPAQKVMGCHGHYGVVISHDAGSYRTIAASVPLASLEDQTWLNVRNEILLRYLEFFGKSRPQLQAWAPAHQAEVVPMRLEATPGDEYLLVMSLTENYLPSKFGVCRLGLEYLFFLFQGVVPSTGVEMFYLPIPRTEGIEGLELHFQVLTGTHVLPPENAQFTNREILTVLD